MVCWQQKQFTSASLSYLLLFLFFFIVIFLTCSRVSSSHTPWWWGPTTSRCCHVIRISTGFLCGWGRPLTPRASDLWAFLCGENKQQQNTRYRVSVVFLEFFSRKSVYLSKQNHGVLYSRISSFSTVIVQKIVHFRVTTSVWNALYYKRKRLPALC